MIDKNWSHIPNLDYVMNHEDAKNAAQETCERCCRGITKEGEQVVPTRENIDKMVRDALADSREAPATGRY